MLTVHIIGTGPGSSELLTKSAEKALNEATIVVGDTRLLSEMTEGKRCIQTYKVNEIRQIVLEADERKRLPCRSRIGRCGFLQLGQVTYGYTGLPNRSSSRYQQSCLFCGTHVYELG